MDSGLPLERRNGPLGDRLTLQLGDNALRQFRSHALGTRHQRLVLTRHSLGQLGRWQHIQHRQRRLGPDPLDCAQQHKRAAVLAGQKSVQCQAGLFPELALHMQQRLVAHRRQAAKGATAAADHIAHAHDVDEGVFFRHLGHDPAQTPDHAGRSWAAGGRITFVMCSPEVPQA